MARLAAAGALQDLIGLSPFAAGRLAERLDDQARNELHAAGKQAVREHGKRDAVTALLAWEVRRGVGWQA